MTFCQSDSFFVTIFSILLKSVPINRRPCIAIFFHRKLFEESKKRSEAVFDKVQSVKRIQESISENVRELNRKVICQFSPYSRILKFTLFSSLIYFSVGNWWHTFLEAENSKPGRQCFPFASKLFSNQIFSGNYLILFNFFNIKFLTFLKESLSNKNRIISEKNEQIRSLNQSVSDTHDAYMHSLEQSELEIDRVKHEYKKKIEEVFSSKEELYNQLQLVRKK